MHAAALFFLCLVMAASVSAQTLMPLTFGFTEPSLDSAGNPLNDLASCTIAWSLDTVEQPSLVFPASSPTGGEAQSRVVPTAVDRSMDSTVLLAAFCADVTGNVGASSEAVSVLIPAMGVVDEDAPGAIATVTLRVTPGTIATVTLHVTFTEDVTP